MDRYKDDENVQKQTKKQRKVHFRVLRKVGESNEFYKTAIGEESKTSTNIQTEETIVCLNVHKNIFLLARSGLEINFYLLVFSLSVLPQSILALYYRNCGVVDDCDLYFNLMKNFLPLKLFGLVFPPAIAWYRIKKYPPLQ